MDCREDPENCSSDKAPSILIEGMPGAVPTGVAELCKARLVEAVRELMDLSRVDEVSLSVRNEGAPRVQSASSSSSQKPRSEDELSVEERAEQCVSRRPFYDFDFLVVPAELRESLLSVDLGKLEKLVFERWNLKAIEPFPRTALNFHGPPGTGKTLAAHALADHLERPVLLASYAQIESKYVGDGAKNVEAVFFAAQRDKAVLFIDEVDSLLSRRLTNVTQGAEQAINSMRSQLLVCLEQVQGDHHLCHESSGELRQGVRNQGSKSLLPHARQDRAQGDLAPAPAGAASPGRRRLAGSAGRYRAYLWAGYQERRN